MAIDSDDNVPDTRRDLQNENQREPPDAQRALPERRRPTRSAWIVDITYREPGYAQRSGIDKPHSGRFVVRAVDRNTAIEQAKIEFEAIARESGVGWVRVIERIDCQRIVETRP